MSVNRKYLKAIFSLIKIFTTLWSLALQILGFCSNFVDCRSFLESNFPDILTLCETNLDDSIDSGNYSVRSYLPLIRKDSSTHIHGLAVYVKEGLSFAWDSSLENSGDSYLHSWPVLLHSFSFSLSSLNHLSYAWFLMLFHLT